MNPPTERLFAALDIPVSNDQGAGIQFDSLQKIVAENLPDFKPIFPLHMTVLFFGSQPVQLIPIIQKALEQGVQRFVQEEQNGIAKLSIQPGALILGKNAVGFTIVPRQAIAQLVSYLEDECTKQQISFASQRGEFVPHVTIGRVNIRAMQREQLAAIASQIPVPIGARAAHGETFTISQLSLYKSLGHSQYEKIASFKI